jgi:aromatic ring-cleaving dioxygenase
MENRVINRGPLSALLHPNTEDEEEEERNHTQRATWIGQAWPLDLSVFKKRATKTAEATAQPKQKGIMEGSNDDERDQLNLT